MRRAVIALWMLVFPLGPAFAQVSLNFDVPGVSIGVNLPVYPTLERVPGYPVYYAPGINSNYFFYDGLYWLFQGDNWYASSWYNGPWAVVDPQEVPLYLLRVPVRYYRVAPAYFRGWNAQDPPRWGEHWGQSWEQRHNGWDRWDRKSAPAPAPLPTYQRQYSGSRYPQPSQQAVIQTQSYRYQPKDPVAQQHFQQQRTQASSAPPQQPAQRPQASRPQQAPVAREQQAPRQPPPQAEHKTPQAPVAHEQQAPRQAPREAERKPQQAPVAREQQAPRQPPQQAERKPQQAPVVREQQAPRQSPQQAERKPQQAPAAREQQAPRPQAQEKAPQEHGKEQGKGQGDNKDSKDNKDR